MVNVLPTRTSTPSRKSKLTSRLVRIGRIGLRIVRVRAAGWHLRRKSYLARIRAAHLEEVDAAEPLVVVATGVAEVIVDATIRVATGGAAAAAGRREVVAGAVGGGVATAGTRLGMRSVFMLSASAGMFLSAGMGHTALVDG